MAFITSIGCAVPKYAIKTADLLDYMQKKCNWNDEESRKFSLLYERSGIDTKYCVLPDFITNKKHTLYAKKAEPLIENRLLIYNQEAYKLSIEAINKCLKKDIDLQKITHLITVSCTGMSAPGIDLQLVQGLGLNKNIVRTSVNFMGCYAAIHALKSASYICNSIENAQVLIVCVELCSLHFNKKNTMDAIASNLLFGDGAAAVLVSNHRSNLALKSFYSEIVFDGQNEMAWNITSKGFLMQLSAYIPALINAKFKDFVEKAATKAMFQKTIFENWALHPGGKKILDLIKISLQISDIGLSSSYEILKNYGNMSSPTVLFVLNHLQENRSNESPIFLAAFGPGLTMESVILT